MPAHIASGADGMPTDQGNSSERFWRVLEELERAQRQLPQPWVKQPSSTDEVSDG
jgi:hypothetical protein